MHNNLIISGLFWLEEQELRINGINLTNWKHLIRYAKIDYIYNSQEQKMPQDNFLYSDFVYQNMFPDCVGSLAHYLAHLRDLTAIHQEFLIVEPMHLRTEANGLFVSEPRVLCLNEKDQRIIIAQINQHFSGIIQLYYFTDSLWLCGLNSDLMNLKKSCGSIWFPTVDIIGLNINDYLPLEQKAMQFMQVLTEIQMLLANLPLNRTRQDCGLLTVNSIWWWDKMMVKNEYIFNLNQIVTPELKAETLGLLSELHSAYCNSDTWGWLQKITDFDQMVAKPLYLKLNRGEIKTMHIIVPLIPYNNGTIRVKLSRYDKYKIWRNPWIKLVINWIINPFRTGS